MKYRIKCAVIHVITKTSLGTLQQFGLPFQNPHWFLNFYLKLSMMHFIYFIEG
jgi:hypothetical protein